MISEGSCDTEAENSALPVILNCNNNLSNSLGEHKRLLLKALENHYY